MAEDTRKFMEKDQMVQGAPLPVARINEHARREMAKAFLKSAEWQVVFLRGGREMKQPPSEREKAIEAGELLPDAPEQKKVPKMVLRIQAGGCPVVALKDVILLLSKDTPRRDLMAGRAIIPGVWHHRAAWWDRTQQSGRGAVTDATCTVYREFGEEEKGFGLWTVEDSCGFRTTFRMVWDATDVEDVSEVEHSGEQGYVVKIGGIHRDHETGLFNYYVTTTQHLTSDGPEYKTSHDAFAENYIYDFKGVYGDPDDPVTHDGGALDVPKAGVPEPGTLVEVRWDKNEEDCTFSAHARTTIAEEGVETRETSQKTQYGREDGVATRGVRDPLPEAAPAAGGVIEQRTSELRPDKLYDVQATVRTELPVEEARKSQTEDLFHEKDSVLDRHQPSAETPTAGPVGTVKVYTTEKTPGGLFDNTVETTVEKEAVKSQATSSKNIYQTQDSETDHHVDAPLGAAPTASGGVVKTHRDQKTPGGKFITTEETTVETPVKDSRKTRTEDLFHEKDSVLDRHQPSAETPTAGPVGTVKVYTTEKTPGGLFDNTVETTVEKEAAKSQTTSSENLFQKQESETDHHVDTALGPAPAPSGGVVKTHRDQKTPGGKYITTEETATEKPVSGARKTSTEDEFHEKDSVLDRHQPSAEVPTVGPVGTVKVYTTEKTPGGLFDNTVETTVEKESLKSQTASSENIYQTQESETDHHVGSPLDLAPAASGGVVKTHRSQKTPGGKYINTEETTTETPVSQARVTETEDLFQSKSSVLDRHQPSAEVPTVGPVGTVKVYTTEKTPGGLFDNTVETIVEKEVGKTQVSSTKTIYQHDESETNHHVSGPLGPAPGAAGGVIKTHKDQKTASGKFITKEETLTETPVPTAQKTVRQKALSKVVTVVDRHVPLSGDPNPGIGEVRSVEKTPGGLENRTHETHENHETLNLDYTIPDGTGRAISIKELYNIDPDAYPEVLAGLDPSLHWSVSSHMDENTGRWNVKATGRRRVPVTEGMTRFDWYEEDIEEVSHKISHEKDANGQPVVRLVLITRKYNRRAAEGTRYVTRKYKQEPARLLGSKLTLNHEKNRGEYVAVTEIKYKTKVVTSDWIDGTEFLAGTS